MAEHYNLPHDTTEAERLLMEHQWGVRVLVFYIHPSIESPLHAPNLRIADIGTGTGAYLRDVEKLLPASAELHGFDIDTTHFPIRGTYATNVFFWQQNITKPWKEARFQGSFDIINVRVVQLGLRNGDWIKAVNNMAMLLKPGGYIQWMEPDHARAQILHNTPGADSSACREVSKFITEWCNQYLVPRPRQLPDLFAQHGLEVVAEELFSTARKQYETSYHTPMLMETVGKRLIDLKIKEGAMTAQEAEALIDKAVMETRHGDVYQHSEIWAVVGEKL